MKLLGFLLAASVVMAALAAAAKVALILLGLLLLFLGATRPRDTLAFLFSIMLLGLAGAYPAATLAVFGVAAFGFVANSKRL